MLFLVLAQMLVPADPAAVSQKFLDAMLAGKSGDAAALFSGNRLPPEWCRSPCR